MGKMVRITTSAGISRLNDLTDFSGTCSGSLIPILHFQEAHQLSNVDPDDNGGRNTGTTEETSRQRTIFHWRGNQQEGHQ